MNEPNSQNAGTVGKSRHPMTQLCRSSTVQLVVWAVAIILIGLWASIANRNIDPGRRSSAPAESTGQTVRDREPAEPKPAPAFVAIKQSEIVPSNPDEPSLHWQPSPMPPIVASHVSLPQANKTPVGFIAMRPAKIEKTPVLPTEPVSPILMTGMKPSIPELRDALRSKVADDRWRATRRIAEMGDSVCELARNVSRLLQDKDVWVRRGAADALSTLRTSDPRVADELLFALHDPDDEVRWQAAYAIGKLRIQPNRCVPALIDSLSDRYLGVRNMAAFALGEFGADATNAIPRLVAAQRDPESIVVETAKLAVLKINADKE